MPLSTGSWAWVDSKVTEILSKLSSLGTKQDTGNSSLSSVQANILSLLSKNDSILSLLLGEDKVLSGKVFGVTTNDLAAAINENPQLLLSNPSNSGKKLKLYQLILGTNVSTNNNIFRLYANPTVTANGTTLAPVPLYIQNPLAQSSMKTFLQPTVSANGSRIINFISGATTSGVLTLQNKIILDPGSSVLITVRPNTTSVTYSANAFWIEET